MPIANMYSIGCIYNTDIAVGWGHLIFFKSFSKFPRRLPCGEICESFRKET